MARLAPDGWRQKHPDSPDSHETLENHDPDLSVCSAVRRAAWARLSAPVDPMVCDRCGSPMRILAIITDPEEVKNDPDNQGLFTIL